MDAKTCKRIHDLATNLIAVETFKACWTLESCDPDRRSAWKPESPDGQSDVTALVLRDLLGGDIIITTVNGSRHYYNRLPDGTDLDLTASRFNAWTPVPKGKPMANPDDLFVGPEAVRIETHKRYSKLSDDVAKAGKDLEACFSKQLSFPFSP